MDAIAAAEDGAVDVEEIGVLLVPAKTWLDEDSGRGRNWEV
jgi:hypothetical protein